MENKLILDGIDCTGLTWKQIEQIFYRRSDVLCDDVSPDDCDCSKCPAHEMCAWICADTSL